MRRHGSAGWTSSSSAKLDDALPRLRSGPRFGLLRRDSVDSTDRRSKTGEPSPAAIHDTRSAGTTPLSAKRSRASLGIHPDRGGPRCIRFHSLNRIGNSSAVHEFSRHPNSACSLPSSTVVWLKVQHCVAYGWVRLSPTVPRASVAGYNVTGSPDWDEVLCGYSGTRRTSCMDLDAARSLWRRGQVVDVEVAW